MMVLVTYDVNTETSAGRRRLNRVAKACEDYGQRVQNSVFECVLYPDEFVQLKDRLRKEIDMELDSLRFYHLGKNWEKKVETMGRDESYNITKDPIIF